MAHSTAKGASNSVAVPLPLPPGKNIILLGALGSGKSYLCESVAGLPHGMKSSTKATNCSGESHTKIVEAVRSRDGTIRMIDCPGALGALGGEDKMEHNLQVARAINMASENGGIHAILIVAKADKTRHGTTISQLVLPLLRRFISKIKLIRVVITHMDEADYPEIEMIKAVRKGCGLQEDKVFCKGSSTSEEEVKTRILAMCNEEGDNWKITDSTFLDYFDIEGMDLEVIGVIEGELNHFRKKISDFLCWHGSQAPGQLRDDSIFEVQAYLKQDITDAKKRVAGECGFDFSDAKGPACRAACGHLANMTNQMKDALMPIATMALGINAENAEVGAGVEVRECPECKLSWVKIEGCNGQTTCGAKPSAYKRRLEFAHFSFDWANNIFSIRPTAPVAVSQPTSASSSVGNWKAKNELRGGKAANEGGGCGASIVWSEMKIVKVPADVQAELAALSAKSAVWEDARGNKNGAGAWIAVCAGPEDSRGDRAWKQLYKDMMGDDDYSASAFAALFGTDSSDK